MIRNKILLAVLIVIAGCVNTLAQNVGSRTASFDLDLTASRATATTVPFIQWISPTAESSFAMSTVFKFKVQINSSSPLAKVTIAIKDSEDADPRASMAVMPNTEAEKSLMTIEKNLTLLDGTNVIQIIAQNTDGITTYSHRTIRVGGDALADAGSLDRTDYAIIFVTNDYDHWPDLVNPIKDGRMIAEELKTNYGFKVEVVENGSQSDILKKLREYAEKKYKPLDQLMIFFAGHGQFDQTFGEGFVVTKESLVNDEAKTTYLSHNRLRSIVNNIPSEHILLAMDVCFGGTFDAAIAHRGLEEYKEATQSEVVTRKLSYKTRRYLTSGGKEYVPDGRPGMNSPFARKILEALRSRGGKDMLLTLGELEGYVEALKPQPRAGEFGDNAPGSDFVFVAK